MDRNLITMINEVITNHSNIKMEMKLLIRLIVLTNIFAKHVIKLIELQAIMCSIEIIMIKIKFFSLQSPTN